MRILIDTHIFLWMLASPEKLSDERRYRLEVPSNEIYLSVMSIAELMIKTSLGKLDFDYDPMILAKEMNVEILEFSGSAAVLLREMPFHHKDPFDRMIIAQSQTSKMKLMSDDKKFSLYDCNLI